MRLVLTVERYAPAIGGAERVVQRIGEGLASRGHEVHVVTGGEHESTTTGGVRVRRFPISGNEVRGMRGDVAAVLGYIDALRPDLILNYAAQSWPTDCCFPLVERSDRPAMMLAPCGFSALRDPRYAGYFSAMRDRLRAYDGLIFHSSIYQDWAFAEEVHAARRWVVPNAADPPSTRSSQLRAAYADRECLVVTVGSHVRTKGHAEFFAAVRALRRDRDVAAVVVAPERRGPDRVRGCQIACQARSGLARGWFGLLDGTDPATVSDALQGADLFLFTSSVECAPLVILEAMAAGTPWVSYNVGNVAELAGGLVAEDFGGLVRLAGHVLDGSGRALGSAGRQAWREHHQWDDVVDRYEQIFSAVADSRARGPAGAITRLQPE
jgi:glycosyltransferase involved in cell wall biosynthesis